MNKKKIFGAALLVALIAPMMAGCKKRNTLAEFTMPEGGYDASKKVTITFYETMGHTLENVLDAYVEDFNALYPNITVKYQSLGNYNDMRDQLQTKLGVEDDPTCSCTFCYPDHVASYRKTKKVVCLDTLMDSTVALGDGIIGFTDEEKADIVPEYLAEGQQFGDNKTYCLPFAKSTEVLYYNKVFFDTNHLQVPTTWDEMWATCAAIKQIDPQCTPLGYDSDSNLFITLSEQYGCPFTSTESPYFLFDNDQTSSFMTMLKDKYDKGYFTTKKTHGSYTSNMFKVDETGAKKCYMSIGSSAGAQYQALENGDPVEITWIPQVDVNNPKVISQGPSVCIFNNKNPQVVIASWLFMKFLITNVDFQSEYSMQSGYAPVIQSCYTNPDYAEELAKGNGEDGGVSFLQAKAVNQTIAQKSAYFSSPVFVGSSLARDYCGEALVGYLTGQRSTPHAALAKAVADCKNQL